jgi:hypothetical protein
MNNTSYKTVKIIGLAIALAFGAQMVSAAGVWVSAPANPPSNNIAAPINLTNKSQTKTGAVWFNNDGGGSVGVTVGQSARLFSTVSGNAKATIQETADAVGALSGVEFRKGLTPLGRFFKRGDTDPAQNDIQIWNSSKAVINVKQDDTTEFASTITIKGGSPAANYVLTAGDTEGSATWQQLNTSGTSNGYTLGSTVLSKDNVEVIRGREVSAYDDPHVCANGQRGYWTSSIGWYWYNPMAGSYGGKFYPQGNNVCQWSYPETEFVYTQTQLQDMSCPAGYVLVGFNLYDQGQNYSTKASLYCKQFQPN